MPKKRILFICVHNSARSQMAEGWFNARHAGRFQAFSAGAEPTRVHPLAVRAMAEIGIDISGHRAKSVDEFAGQAFDFVVTVCGEDEAECPFFPGPGERIHHGFSDPAACAGTEDERLACFRRSRDEIGAWIDGTLAGAREEGKAAGQDPLELAVDKFLFRFPQDLLFSRDGLWLRFEGNRVRLGLSDFLQQRSGDVTFAIPKERGTIVHPGDELAVVETIKVNVGLVSPVAGKVVETNPDLQSSPELVNQDPYGRGWLAVIEVENADAARRSLMSAKDYLEMARVQAEAETGR